MAGPLTGIRILDWTIWQQGPLATAMLGDLGAEVIKIEDRRAGDPGRGVKEKLHGTTAEEAGRNFFFETNNRNKRSIAVDLSRPKGKELVYRLVQKSDVFVQNFRMGVAARLGMDYQTLSIHNPLLIYAGASGWGLNGPDAALPSFDIVVQARSGFMHAGTEPGAPHRIRGAMADQMSAVMLAYAILAALMGRERLGVGQEIHVSQLSSMLTLQGLLVNQLLITGEEQPQNPRTAFSNPLSNVYECNDKRWIALALLQGDRYWHDFCEAVGITHLEKNPKFENQKKRDENRTELISILDKLFATKNREEWLSILRQYKDLVIGPVNSVTEAVNDPQVAANNYVTNFNHPVWGPTKMLNVPISFSKTPVGMTREAPEFGQHTEEILLDVCGYKWEEIALLKEDGAIV
ncbi:MAG: CoA transferase [Dehalococcoidia bacterium]|nr:CoA transferase [Dehalococcoidia bacterium]